MIGLYQRLCYIVFADFFTPQCGTLWSTAKVIVLPGSIRFTVCQKGKDKSQKLKLSDHDDDGSVFAVLVLLL